MSIDIGIIGFCSNFLTAQEGEGGKTSFISNP
jgi:hypothetical protein